MPEYLELAVCDGFGDGRQVAEFQPSFSAGSSAKGARGDRRQAPGPRVSRSLRAARSGDYGRRGGAANLSDACGAASVASVVSSSRPARSGESPRAGGQLALRRADFSLGENGEFVGQLAKSGQNGCRRPQGR